MKEKYTGSQAEEIFAAQLSDVGLVYIREFRFHPVRKWRFDFSFPERMIAVEVNGGIFTRGRHARGGGLVGDYEKLNEAQLLGWKVYQFSPSQVRRRLALKFLWRAMDGAFILPKDEEEVYADQCCDPQAC